MVGLQPGMEATEAPFFSQELSSCGNKLKFCVSNSIPVKTNSNPVSGTWSLWEKVSLCGFRTRGVFKAFIMCIRSELCPIWFVTAKIVSYLFLDIKKDAELLNILTNILKREESSPEQVKT